LCKASRSKPSIAAIESEALKVTWNSTWMKPEAASQNTMCGAILVWLSSSGMKESSSYSGFELIAKDGVAR